MDLFPFMFQMFRFPILQNQPSLCKWQNIILRLHPPFLTYATSSVVSCLQKPVHPTPSHTSQKPSPSPLKRLPFPRTGCHCLSLNSPQIICITLRFSYSFLKLATFLSWLWHLRIASIFVTLVCNPVLNRGWHMASVQRSIFGVENIWLH